MEMFMEQNQLILRGYGKQAEKDEVTRKLKEVMEGNAIDDYRMLKVVLDYLEGN